MIRLFAGKRSKEVKPPPSIHITKVVIYDDQDQEVHTFLVDTILLANDEIEFTISLHALDVDS